MTPFQIAWLFCRCLAVWLLVQALQNLAVSADSILGMWSLMGKWTQLPKMVTVVLLSTQWMCNLVLCLIFWFAASLIAKNMVVGQAQESLQNQISVKQWQNITFSAIGIYVLVLGLSNLCSVVGFSLFQSAIGGKNAFDTKFVTSIIRDTLRVVFGIYLLLHAQSLLRELESSRRGFRDEVNTDL